MEPHPLAERYPLLEGDEYEAFKADIATNGQRNPIWKFEGKILDGRNRHRACTELAIPVKTNDFHGTPEEAAAFVESQNTHRRHLTAEFRRERVRAMRAEGMSTRKIAAALNVSQSVVVKDIKAGEHSCSPAPIPEDKDSDAHGTRTDGTGAEVGGDRCGPC